MALGIIGIILALAVFMIGVYKGLAPYWVAVISVLIVAVTNRLVPIEALVTGENSFISGMSSFMVTVFACVFGGTILGSVYSMSGAAHSIATTLTRLIPVKQGNDKKTVRIAITILMIINAIFMFGGLDAYASTFVLIPIFLVTFEACDIPKKFVPAMQILTWPFLCMPGCPQIFNIVGSAAMTEAGFPVGPAGGTVPGLIAGFFGAVVCWLALTQMIIKAKERGEHFEWGKLENVQTNREKDEPNFIVSLIPLVVVFVLYTILKLDIFWALGSAIILGLILFSGNFEKADISGNRMNLFRRITHPVNEGAMKFPNALFTVMTPSGLATVIIGTSAFGAIVNGMSQLDMNPLVLTVIFTCIIVAITSAPPVALNVCLPIIVGIAAAQLDDAVPAAAIMRLAIICVMTFETLPFGGQVVLGIQLAGESHKTSYKPIFVTTVMIPLVTAFLGLLLFMVFPG